MLPLKFRPFPCPYRTPQPPLVILLVGFVFARQQRHPHAPPPRQDEAGF